MTNENRNHIIVIRFCDGHRVVGEMSPQDVQDRVDYAERVTGDPIRDIDCSASCWCVEEGTYDHFWDRRY